ncbi:hypothetical protein HQ545_02695 [Candidatus Woesearchaeota archaeon]|nr:hypothetical protein [Candidatus Woesearchaeota archaeon]
MRSNNNTEQRSMKNAAKIFIVLLLAVVLTSVLSTIVQAGPFDSLRTGWSQIRFFVFSAAFWINSLIVFGAAFLGFILLLKDKLGSDNTQKIVMYIIIGIVALITASKIVADTGQPVYLWEKESFAAGLRFLIGPSPSMESCRADGPSMFRSWLSIDPNPPCCGAGAYYTDIQGERVCRQAIFRTNEQGTGLPAFIAAGLLLFLLLHISRGALGLEGLGDSGSKWFTIILSGFLAALIAHQRVSRSAVLIVAGWIAVFMIGRKLSGTMGEGDPQGLRRGFAFGLAFALVTLILNMLGTSLFGAVRASGEITLMTIGINIFWGIIIGYIYGALVGDGLLGTIMQSMGEEKRAKIESLCDRARDDGKFRDYGRAFLSGLPLIGRFVAKPGATRIRNTNRRREDRMAEQIVHLEEQYNNAVTQGRHADSLRIAEQLNRWKDSYRRLLAEGERPDDDEPGTHPGGTDDESEPHPGGTDEERHPPPPPIRGSPDLPPL